MRRARITALEAVLALAAIVAGAAHPLPAHSQVAAPADSFSRFFEQLADSTDAHFGAATVAFDTTGLDTLAAFALERPPVLPRRGKGGALFPVLGFHRALGATVGAGVRGGSPSAGMLDLRGAYATSAKLGRYALAWRRTLWSPGGPLPRFQARREGRIGERRRLDLELRYAREDLTFMPEHAGGGRGTIRALVAGTGEQSLFESRGGTAGLALWAGDWRLRAGVETARESALPIATRFSLLGREADVLENTAATADEFTAPFGDVAFLRRDWGLAGVLAGRGGGSDRWRLRGALGKSVRVGANFRVVTQLEAGATAAGAPRQRRFELGGGLAVPTLAHGHGGSDHLLMSRVELTGAQDVLRALRLPHPEWLVLEPSAFFDYGSTWDDPAGRDVVFSRPPSGAWRGAAGGGVAWRIGVPEPDVSVRVWMAWPIGPDSGTRRLSLAVGGPFGLLGRL